MASYTPAPNLKRQLLTDGGAPLAAGRIYTFLAGTSTPVSTYKTSSGTAWGSYIQLDSAGRPENGEVYLAPGTSYKFEARTSAGVTLWTQDNIPAVPGSAASLDFTITLGANVDAGDLVYASDGTAITAGTWGKADADLAYASTTPELAFALTSGSSGDQIQVRQGGIMELAGPLSPGAKYYASATAGAITTTAPVNARYVGQALSVTTLLVNNEIADSATDSVVIDPKIKTLCNGRLSLTTGVPITVTDVTAATTLYWVPYLGNTVGLYTGTRWKAFELSQLSIAVPATTATAYDVFIDYNAGTPALSVTAWTNITTRATALTTQDGVDVLTGSTGKRYVGSFETTGVSGQTEDSAANRLLYNHYNQVPRPLRVHDSTDSWTYSTATYRQARATTTNQVAVMVGAVGSPVSIKAIHQMTNSSGNPTIAYTSIGYDSTTTPATGVTNHGSGTGNPVSITANPHAELVHFPAVGVHTYVWLEAPDSANATSTWYGDGGVTFYQTGLIGSVTQ
jgi:hypothetical protein